MRVISPLCSALFRRMPVCLFGAAALAFAVLTTSPALAESGENPVASCPENADAELFRAAHRGNVARAKHLLSECGADVNARNYHNQTPLTWATRSGNVDMVSLLLDKEADVHARDKAGHTILHTAVRENHPEMVEVILAHFRTDVNVMDHTGWTPMDWAAITDNAHLAGVLKDAGGECNGRKELPLCSGIVKESCMVKYFGYASLADVYRELWAEMRDRGRWGLYLSDQTYMHLLVNSSAGGDATVEDIALCLIDNGADVNAKDNNGWTPLHRAAFHNNSEMARLFLENGADVNAQDKYGKTPLDAAASNWSWRRNAEVAALLRKRGGRCLGETWRPFCYGAERGLGKGADVNAKERDGMTYLHVAVLEDAVKVARSLLENGADVNAKVSSTDGNWGAVPQRMWQAGDTPLHMAVWRGGATEMVALLLENGADVNAKNNATATPLHRAIRKQSVETVRLLLDNGADMSGLSSGEFRGFTFGGLTPLGEAILLDSVEIVRLLLENGADANELAYHKENCGFTRTERLVNGAWKRVSYRCGSLPLDLAANKENAEIAALLLDLGGECRWDSGALCHGAPEQPQNEQSDEQLSAQSDAAREDLTEVVAEGIDALPPSFNALATDVGFTRDMKVRLNARRDFRWDGADWGMEAHIGAVGESDSQAAFTGVNGSKDFAGGWRAVGAAKVARGWAQLEGGLERGALWASEFSAGFERLGLFYGGDALGFGVSQPLHVEHWEAETADGRRFRGSRLSGRVLNVDASYRIPLPGGENGAMEFSTAIGRESGSGSGFAGNALISAEWDF